MASESISPPGDTVLWHGSPDPALIGFTVYGEGDGGSFHSYHALSYEAVYTV